MTWLIDVFAHLSDVEILAVGGLSNAVIAIVIAVGVKKRSERTGQIHERSALADVLHGSLLAFLVFVVSNVLSNDPHCH